MRKAYLPTSLSPPGSTINSAPAINAPGRRGCLRDRVDGLAAGLPTRPAGWCPLAPPRLRPHPPLFAASGDQPADLSGLELPSQAWQYILKMQEGFAQRERELAENAFKCAEQVASSERKQSEREQTISQLERKLGEARLSLQNVTTTSAERATDILRLQGRVNMRGVMERIEKEEAKKKTFKEDATRQQKWRSILESEAHASLQKDFLREMDWKTPVFSSYRLVDLYASLSMNQHPLVSREEARRVGGFVMTEDMRDQERAVLKYLCQHFGFDYRVVLDGQQFEAWQAIQKQEEVATESEAKDGV